MSGSWLIAVIAVVGFAALALLLRKLASSWLSPAPFAVAYWGFAFGLPLFAAPDFEVWAPAEWMLLLFAALFGTAALAAERLTARGPAARPVPFATRPLRLLTLAATLVGFAAVQVLLSVYGRSFADLAHAATWAELGNAFSVARYEDAEKSPLLARLLSAGFYAGCLVGGVLWVEAKRRTDRVLALAPLAAAILYGSVMTTRASIFCAFILFVSAIFAMRVREQLPVRRLLRLKPALAALALAAASVAGVALLQLSRAGIDDVSMAPAMLDHLRPYFLGHVAAFSAWLRETIGDPPRLAFGQRTFGGVFELLGMRERTQGLFTDFATFGNGRSSNVYTAFRGLIEDFGLTGAMLATAAAGAAAGWAHSALARGSGAALPVLALVFSFVLWSPIGSVTYYNTLLGSFGVLWACLAVSAPRASVGDVVERSRHLHPRAAVIPEGD